MTKTVEQKLNEILSNQELIMKALKIEKPKKIKTQLLKEKQSLTFSVGNNIKSDKHRL